MKITDIELHEIHPPLQAWNRDAHRLFQGTTWDTRTIIVLHTDSGLEGLGECLGAVVSNGRIFYTSQASGFVVSQTYGKEAENLRAVWERP